MVTRSILRPVLRPVTRAVSDTIRGFNPRSLFYAGEQGIWLDPSDFSTLFQDAAGTTPVTAVGQPVGKILDKSGRGNHATQSTSASRPTVEARVNLFTKTQEFDHANWSISGATVIANATTAPDGTLTADKIVEDVANSGHFVTQAGIGRRCRIRAKAAERNWLLVYSGVANSNVYVNLTTGAYTVGPDVVSVSTSSLGDGWWLVDIVWNTLATATRFYGTTGSNVAIWAGDGVSGIYVWGAELIYDATANYPYQRVNTATDYVDVGAPRYLQLDGTDDGMATPSIDFTGTDKMTVWAGVRKLSDAATGVVVELSAIIGANNGAFLVLAPASAAANAQYAVKGTTQSSATPSGLTSPLTFVMCGQSNIAAPSVSARINGVVSASNTFSQGTGNYGNYPLYIGRRNNASLPFNGRIYQLIVRGAASSGGQIAAGEAWCNGKTRAY